MIITIDGMSGAGTTTQAMRLAQEQGWPWFSAGGDFRAFTYQAIQLGYAKPEIPEDEWDWDGIKTLALEARIAHDGAGNIAVNGVDVTDHLDDHIVNKVIAHVTSLPEVRSPHNHRLQELARKYGDVVFEGRATASIFPTALHLWLEVDPDHAHKRVAEGRGLEVAQHNAKRNQLDTERTLDPAKPADDAIIIDTTGKNRDEVFAEVTKAAETRAN